MISNFKTFSANSLDWNSSRLFHVLVFLWNKKVDLAISVLNDDEWSRWNGNTLVASL